jgi:hypothetical protein
LNTRMTEKAEKFANQYIWRNEFSRENFIKTLIIQGETVQAIKERWQNLADGSQDNEPDSNKDMDSNKKYREEIDTINAHYMAILTDLLSTASPIENIAE